MAPPCLHLRCCAPPGNGNVSFAIRGARTGRGAAGRKAWSSQRADIKTCTLKFGPQHPAAHGVLRLVLELAGKMIQRADLPIGLLHRATKKRAETRIYIPVAAYVDRLVGLVNKSSWNIWK